MRADVQPVAHIDYDSVTTLDALIDISDAAARAAMLSLRDQLDRSGLQLEQRLVHDGTHRKPVIAFYRGSEPLLHVFPEPNVGTGLHVAIPIRAWERRMLRTADLPAWLREAVDRSRPRHNMIWVDAVLRDAGRVSDLVNLLVRKADLQPTLH